jgi:hypothetical protein
MKQDNLDIKLVNDTNQFIFRDLTEPLGTIIDKNNNFYKNIIKKRYN